VHIHEQINELLAAFALDELSEQQKTDVRIHLAECEICHNELKQIQKLLEITEKIKNKNASEQLCQSAGAAVLTSIEKQNKEPAQLIRKYNFWRFVMKNRITKLATAAVFVIAALTTIHFLGSPIESTAFAEVMENIKNARTLTYQSAITPAGQEPQLAKTMVLEPNLLRVELPDGKILILDYGQSKTLLLDSKNKQAVLSSTPQKTSGLYDTFRQFRNIPGFSVNRIGQRTVDGMNAIGFQLTREKDDNVIIIWANSQNSLPIRIEHTAKDKDGKIVTMITTDITFDAKLDETLFCLDVPKGYSHQFVDGPAERSFKLKTRSQTQSNMMEILRNCLVYTQENEGKWPDSLQDLTQYGLSKDTLNNPRYPKREIGYVYLKLSKPLSPSQVVLYEVYDSWGDGINVGYADGHVEFIEKESKFKNEIKKLVEPN